MVSLIRLAWKCQRCVDHAPVVPGALRPKFFSLLDEDTSLKGSKSAIWRNHVRGSKGAPEKRTFLDWIAAGNKYARLAAGGKSFPHMIEGGVAESLTGSMYILVLVAVQNLRIAVGAADGNIAGDVGNLLRWPDGAIPHISSTYTFSESFSRLCVRSPGETGDCTGYRASLHTLPCQVEQHTSALTCSTL